MRRLKVMVGMETSKKQNIQRTFFTYLKLSSSQFFLNLDGIGQQCVSDETIMRRMLLFVLGGTGKACQGIAHELCHFDSLLYVQ